MYRVRQQIGYDTHFFCRENPNDYAVAIVDSGVVKHPDLERQVIAFYDFSDERYEYPSDPYGHGTHVAGCLLGNGELSGGRYQGICPNAKFVAFKVLNKEGKGEAGWLIQALKYILDHHRMWNIRIVNLSLGVEKEVGDKALSIIISLVKEIMKQGILVVCAAGNYGPKDNTIYGIGTLKEVITVGCYDGIYERGNSINCRLFSGRGDRESNIIKPDIVAPGTKIISCSNKVEYIRRKGYRKAYEEKSGTSMSAPIISGILFGVLLNFPGISCQEAKKIVLSATKDIGYEKNMQGNGFIDCQKVIRAKK